MLSHLRRWRLACAILIQPSLCYELLHTIFPTGPQPSLCLQEKCSLIAMSRHSVFSSFFYMLLDAWLSALNSEFSSLCWVLGWFCFSWCSWLTPCCFLALPVNPYYLASNLYLVYLVRLRLYETCFIHADLLNSTPPDLTLATIHPWRCSLLPPLSESGCLALLAALQEHLWSSSPLEMPLWPQFGFLVICHPWTRPFLAQCSAQFYSETHPRPVSPHWLFPDKFQQGSSW